MNTKTTSLDSGLHSDESPQRGAWLSRHQAVVTALLVTLTLLIAASWLVFPYYIKDHDLIASLNQDTVVITRLGEPSGHH